MEKKCKDCLETKPLDDFYRHKKMTDGRLGSCKECVKERVRANRRALINFYRAYDRKRGNRQSKEYHREYYQANRDAIMEKQRKDRAERKEEEYLARSAVGNAIRDGRLLRPDKCEGCDKTVMPHGHHEDYEQKLEVIWLCPECHGFVHKISRERLR